MDYLHCRQNLVIMKKVLLFMLVIQPDQHMNKLIVFLLCSCCLNASFAQRPIDTTATFNIGGIKQFVVIRSDDRQKPLLLYFTGGPGESSIGHSDVFTDRLRQNFVLVEWDQRNCGKTMELNPSPRPVTLTLCKKDARDLADTLLHRFHRQKLFIFGWSWGTVLGFDLAKRMPEKVYAYFAVSPVVDQVKSERILWQEMKDKAKKDGNTAALADLAKVKIPFDNAEQVFFDRKWMFILINGRARDEQELRNVFFDPKMQWMYPLSREYARQNLIKVLPAIHCPVYFFIGKQDQQTNHTIGEAYYKSIKAPKKGIFLFEKSAHLIPFTEPDLFQQDMISAAKAAVRG
jgi:pimeloyl-ACP methyl ester carboxylesterase